MKKERIRKNSFESIDFNCIMRIKALKLILYLLIFFSFSSYAATLTGKVIRVSDGDTIVVLEGITQHKIRLVGIDAPEKKQAFGNKSKETLADAVAGKTVDVDYNKRDRYKRIIGKVIYRGQDMNLRQVQMGMAWHYKQYEREQDVEDRSRYAQAEYLAQRDRAGLWSDKAPVPPWEFRKKPLEK
ncbi:Endonuclease YncB, thermonuclease family [Methylobacillus rhizosphaerae]|uniref:Endonuclease YncB, thermonuclease family n=1 Tax=Methylobacillus rhizosphaerae TaxID=551994 RepID=A0A238YRI1_9PROT|nr:thermonuclease family protein [Methylobacillus rhizosphaerae]SNR73418.1 Endonuclease YncB, thermonuclease family [Methylobacillus rhizosphaerae]